MEKIILVYYINMYNVDNEKIEYYLGLVKEKIFLQDDSIIQYFIPIRNGETRVECINPKLVSEEDYKEVKELLDKTKEKLNKIISDEI